MTVEFAEVSVFGNYKYQKKCFLNLFCIFVFLVNLQQSSYFSFLLERLLNVPKFQFFVQILLSHQAEKTTNLSPDSLLRFMEQ